MSSILYLLYSSKKIIFVRRNPTWFCIYKVLLKFTNKTQKKILKNGIVYHVLMSRRLPCLARSQISLKTCFSLCILMTSSKLLIDNNLLTIALDISSLYGIVQFFIFFRLIPKLILFVDVEFSLTAKNDVINHVISRASRKRPILDFETS